MRRIIAAEPAVDSSTTSALSMHRFFFRLAFSVGNMFVWIFIFQYFYVVENNLAFALARAALLFALGEVALSIVTPYAARMLRTGALRSMKISLVAAAAAFVVLGASFEGFWSAATPSALVLFAVVLGLSRSLYWVAYETASGGVLRESRRLLPDVLIALVPAAVGIYIAASPNAPVWILFGSAVVIVCSMLPLARASDFYENFSWGYRETYYHLLAPEQRPLVAQALLEGATGAALLFFWPIAIFLIAGWSYGLLGIVLSVTFLAGLFAREFVRTLLRRTRLHESRLLTTALAVSPWLLRLMVATPVGVVLVDSYFYITSPRRFGIDPFVSLQAADAGSYLDEYTALKEIALSLGRVAICVLGALAALFFSAPYAFIAVFIVAAFASTAAALRSS